MEAGKEVIIRIGTRGSRLALEQAGYVAQRLCALDSSRDPQLVKIQTAGDRFRNAPLTSLGGDGVFTKEIQRALREQRIDVAVHSLKDLPTAPVEGLMLAAIPPRGPAADVFISRRHRRFDDLPPGATVGTSSLRRRALALSRRPDLNVVDVRGNIETRLRKLEEQHLDGLLLAQAGLERLRLASVVNEILDTAWMLPAVGQGALGLECRSTDLDTRNALHALDHLPSRQAVTAERALLSELGGGCLIPLGVESRAEGEILTLRAVVTTPDAHRRIEGQGSGPRDQPEALGRRVALELRRQGADELLAMARQT